MINKTHIMDTIWSKLTNQIIQNVSYIKPHFWIFTFKAKANGFLILNMQNDRPVFSIQDKTDVPLFNSFSEPGLTNKLKGSQFVESHIHEDQAVIVTLKQDQHLYSLKIQLAPFAPRFQLIHNEKIDFDSILGWQPNKLIKSKSSVLIFDDSLNLDSLIRYSYSLDYLQIVKKTLIKKLKRQEALDQDLKNHHYLMGYQALAEAIQTKPNMPWKDYENPNNLPPPHVNFKTDFFGSNELFQTYKKAKKGVALTQAQLLLNQGLIEVLTPYSILVPPLSTKELANLKSFLEREHLLSGMEHKPTEVVHHSPYYVEHNGIRFSFGKNAKQNHQLTFSIAKKNEIFMHIEGKSGSHLIVHHTQFDHDLIVKGAQLVLALAKQIAGTVTYAKVGSLKQTKTLGLVLMKDAKKVKVNADLEFTNKILLSTKRY
ncbi:MAG: hypothetical protein RL379_820 [Bacillota bacterium]